uniref:Uncharacterized protein n=2 Tax=Caenorhabditis japonica TaxID=281687 RepID=A0A8R1IBD1_CAEJA
MYTIPGTPLYVPDNYHPTWKTAITECKEIFSTVPAPTTIPPPASEPAADKNQGGKVTKGRSRKPPRWYDPTDDVSTVVFDLVNTVVGQHAQRRRRREPTAPRTGITASEPFKQHEIVSEPELDLETSTKPKRLRAQPAPKPRNSPPKLKMQPEKPGDLAQEADPNLHRQEPTNPTPQDSEFQNQNPVEYENYAQLQPVYAPLEHVVPENFAQRLPDPLVSMGFEQQAQQNEEKRVVAVQW